MSGKALRMCYCRCATFSVLDSAVSYQLTGKRQTDDRDDFIVKLLTGEFEHLPDWGMLS